MSLVARWARKLFGHGEARGSTRLPCRCQVAIHNGRDPHFQAVVTDISRTGLRLQGAASLRRRDKLEVSHPGGRPLEGVVVWCHDGSAGVRFTSCDLDRSWACGLLAGQE